MSAHNHVLIHPVIVVWTKAVDRPNGIAVQLARLEIEPIKTTVQSYKVHTNRVPNFDLIVYLWMFARPRSWLNWRCVKSVMQTWWNVLVQYWMGLPDLNRAQVAWLGSCGISQYTYCICIFQICTVNLQIKASALKRNLRRCHISREIRLWDIKRNVSMMQYRTLWIDEYIVALIW